MPDCKYPPHTQTNCLWGALHLWYLNGMQGRVRRRAGIRGARWGHFIYVHSDGKEYDFVPEYEDATWLGQLRFEGRYRCRTDEQSKG